MFFTGERLSTGQVHISTIIDPPPRFLVNKFLPAEFHFFQRERDCLHHCNTPTCHPNIIEFLYALEHKPIGEDGKVHIHSFYTVSRHPHASQGPHMLFTSIPDLLCDPLTNERVIWNIMHKLALGIGYLHQDKGITHNDLLPEAVACSRTSCKVLNFHTAEHTVESPHAISRYGNYTALMKYLKKLYSQDHRLRNLRGDSFPPEFESYHFADVSPATPYDMTKKDIWCMGIIMLRLHTRRDNLLRMNSDFEAANFYQQSPWFCLLCSGQFRQYFESHFPRGVGPLGVELMERMLQPNASQRINIAQVLQHPYFTSILR